MDYWAQGNNLGQGRWTRIIIGRWCEVVQFWINVEMLGFCGGLNEKKKQVKGDSKDFGLSN